MAANEIEEKLAAAAWVRIEPTTPEDGQFTDGTVGFRSAVGIKTARILAIDDLAQPLLIIELEQPQTRRETVVHANSPVTTANSGRYNYPAATSQFQFQPLHLDWIGDPLAPSWLPFQLNQDLLTVPPQFDQDIYNAVGILLEAGEGTLAQDVMLTIWKLPKLPQSQTSELEATIVIGP